MQPGEHVYLRAYGDEVIRRRVVAVSDRLVYICWDDEYETARREGHEPISIGFPLSDVIMGDELDRIKAERGDVS